MIIILFVPTAAVVIHNICTLFFFIILRKNLYLKLKIKSLEFVKNKIDADIFVDALIILIKFYSTTAISSPASTCCPSFTCMSTTVPATGDRIFVSIFMASITAIGVLAST